jgi:hypothetical protein
MAARRAEIAPVDLLGLCVSTGCAGSRRSWRMNKQRESKQGRRERAHEGGVLL